MRPPESLRLLVPGDLPPFLQRRFSEKDGRLGTVTYIKFKDFHLSDGRIALRVAKTSDNVRLPDGVVVQTASHSTIYSEMIKSMRRDGPLASFLSFALVAVVVIVSTHSKRGAFVVLASLLMGVICTLGGAAIFDARLHYVNFIALPITFGIGCEYPFNVYDRTRILGGDISLAVRRTAGAVALCSYTTIVGYSSLVFNDFQALQSFGQLAMAGEAACIVAAIFVVPSLLFVLRGETPS
jgi:predicted RND superfamily exporter protein